MRPVRVDDEPLISDLFARFLSRRGYAVGTIWTITGKADDDALEKSFERGAAEVFTEPLNLPRLDGLLQPGQGRIAAGHGD